MRIKRRKSKQREAILRVIRGTNIHPTADWIYDQVRKEIPSISLGTVYRNLNLLIDEGLVKELNLYGTSSARYDANLDPHYHFICLKCNSIYDLPEKNFSPDISPLVEGRNFKVKFVKLDIYGFCDKCPSDDEA